jgi:hypothetical protein
MIPKSVTEANILFSPPQCDTSQQQMEQTMLLIACQSYCSDDVPASSVLLRLRDDNNVVVGIFLRRMHIRHSATVVGWEFLRKRERKRTLA